MGFVLGMTDSEITGTVLERRIEEVLAMGAKATQVYKPRQGSNAGSKNLKHYTDEMIAYAKEKAGDLLHVFGYTDVDPNLIQSERQSDNRTPVFKIDSTS